MLLTGASLPLQALILDTFNRVVNIVFQVFPVGWASMSAEAVSLAGPPVGLGDAGLVRKERCSSGRGGRRVWTMRDGRLGLRIGDLRLRIVEMTIGN